MNIRKERNGIQILPCHRNGYTTYYNHLSRIARGVRLSQKQVIGYVCSTGLSIGPHRHYRVSHNRTFVNPLSEQILPGEPIAKAQYAHFLEHARARIERLGQEVPFQL
ncbi:MAG: M23 family metallopeptidase [Burkholderiales bacterium]